MNNQTGKIPMDKTPKMVEVITEYKACDVVVGGKIFISTEDAKVILHRTQIVNSEPAKEAAIYVGEEDYRMLFECRDLLRKFAKNILQTPSTDASIGDLLSKYI